MGLNYLTQKKYEDAIGPLSDAYSSDTTQLNVLLAIGVAYDMAGPKGDGLPSGALKHVHRAGFDEVHRVAGVALADDGGPCGEDHLLEFPSQAGQVHRPKVGKNRRPEIGRAHV